MRRIARENGPSALAALIACAAIAYLGRDGLAWGDYEHEAAPAFTALVHGHVGAFLRLAPAYGGSLIERAPFALVPGLWGGGALAVYRAVAVPGLLATAVLAVWLLARMRAEGRPPAARALVLVVCAANPMTLHAIEMGHPEEILGACLCVAAVLLAAEQRPLWAALALGLAVANKPWALLATGPVLLALAPRRRLSCAACATAVAGALLAPLVLVHSGGFVAASRASAAPGGSIFHPWQIFWFLGRDPAARTAGAAGPGARVGPAWTAAISHPLILAIGLALSVALWGRERRSGATRARTALLALALLLLMRCVLDIWDIGYYTLPFLLALLAWELRGPTRPVHLLAATCTALASVTFLWLPNHAAGDLQAGFFLAWALPLAALLAARLFEPGFLSRAPRPQPCLATEPQEMTVSALSRPLST